MWAGDIIVLKFGSSVLRHRDDLPGVVHEIYRWYRAGWRVVTVVSAIGDASDLLLAQAHGLTATPQPHATAELLATCERHSAALLGIALGRAGIPSRVIDPRELHLIVEGDPLDSEPVALDRDRLEELLRDAPVLVVPGFFGYTTSGRLQLLGRGGSDLTAVFLANALRANRCRLIKDVDGVYERDPALASSALARRYVALSYADAVERAAQLIQPKAVRFLERHGANAEVAAIATSYESTIGRFDRVLAAPGAAQPLSVLLLGLGTVGFGVYQRIAAMPEHFRVVAALVRDRAKHMATGIPNDRLRTATDELSGLHADVVVDALPDVEASQALVRWFLARGVPVVSANKGLIAEAGPDLAALAARHRTTLLYSAAVGGSAPMVEALRRLSNDGAIRCIAGILSGTCNYVLTRCSEGLLLNEAVREAQDRGFAEADPTEDLSGGDAARKLQILARHAFGQELGALDIEPLDASTFLRVHATLQPGETPRAIARAWKIGSRVFGQVRLEAVDQADPLAQVHGEWNRLIITRANGADLVVDGRGAGRWPTTEAIMADLIELRLTRRCIGSAVEHPDTRK